MATRDAGSRSGVTRRRTKTRQSRLIARQAMTAFLVENDKDCLVRTICLLLDACTHRDTGTGCTVDGSSRAGVMAVFLRTIVLLRVGVVNRPKNQREFCLFYFTIMNDIVAKGTKEPSRRKL